MATWRKTGKNWVKGSKVLNISNRYKVNKLIGYTVNLYDFKMRGTLTQQRRVLRVFKTKLEARQFVGAYMRKH
jgi:hypothetical protein